MIEGLLKEHQKGKDIGLGKKDSLGKTAAHIAYDNCHYQTAKLLDDHSHTLSTSEREVLNRKLMAVGDPNITNMHQDILDVLEKGRELTKEIADMRQHVVKRALLEAEDLQDDGELTDSEDLALLNRETEAFFITSGGGAVGASLWQKPVNTKHGIRELCRETLSGNSARFVHQLRATRGENAVAITQDKITVQLLTTK